MASNAQTIPSSLHPLLRSFHDNFVSKSDAQAEKAGPKNASSQYGTYRIDQLFRSLALADIPGTAGVVEPFPFARRSIGA